MFYCKVVTNVIDGDMKTVNLPFVLTTPDCLLQLTYRRETVLYSALVITDD